MRNSSHVRTAVQQNAAPAVALNSGRHYWWRQPFAPRNASTASMRAGRPITNGFGLRAGWHTPPRATQNLKRRAWKIMPKRSSQVALAQMQR